MKNHELAAYFPMLQGEEYENLKDDIEANGQLEPITRFEGEILDGRNRQKVCDDLGIEPVYREYKGDNPLDYVVSMNLMRRHMTAGQKAAVGARLTEHVAVGYTGHDQSGSSSATLQKSTVADVTEKIGAGSQAVVAARKLHQERPDLFEQLEQGNMSATEARALAPLTPVEGEKLQDKAEREELSDRQMVKVSTEMRKAKEFSGDRGVKAVLAADVVTIKETVVVDREPVRRPQPKKKPKKDPVSWLQNRNVTAVLDWAKEYRGIWNMRLTVFQNETMHDPAGLDAALGLAEVQLSELADTIAKVRAECQRQKS